MTFYIKVYAKHFKRPEHNYKFRKLSKYNNIINLICIPSMKVISQLLRFHDTNNSMSYFEKGHNYKKVNNTQKEKLHFLEPSMHGSRETKKP